MLEKIVYIACTVIVFFVCQWTLFVIRKYHQDKPLGMQTLLGKVIVIFLKVFAFAVGILSSSMILTELHGPFSEMVAFSWWLISCVLILTLYLAFLTMMATKYFLIYHGPYMDDVNEEKYLKRLKMLLIIFPTFLVCFELTLFSNLMELATFQQLQLGYSKQNAGLEITMMALMLLSLLAMITMQARIEYDAFHAQDLEGGIFVKVLVACKSTKQQPTANAGYTANVTRIAVGLGIMLFIIILIQLFGGADNTKWNQLYFAAIMANVMPSLFIYNHPGMKKIAQKFFSRPCMVF